MCDDIDISEATKALLIGHAKKSAMEGYTHKTPAQQRTAADRPAASITTMLEVAAYDATDAGEAVEPAA